MFRGEPELISWVLQKLASEEYELEDLEDGGVELTITDSGQAIERLEQELFWRGGVEDLDALGGFLDGFRENNSPQNLRTLLEQFFKEEKCARLEEVLRGTSYDFVVERICDELREGDRAREGAALSGIERCEGSGAGISWRMDKVDGFKPMLTAPYVRRLAALIPKMVRRGEDLWDATTKVQLPDEVWRYTEEAAKCYVFGLYRAGAVLCRSAIDFAIREILERRGKQAHVATLEREKKDTFGNVILLALEHLPWQLKEALRDAQGILETVNKIVHEGDLPSERCREIILKTRSVLKTLYQELKQV